MKETRYVFYAKGRNTTITGMIKEGNQDQLRIGEAVQTYEMEDVSYDDGYVDETLTTITDIETGDVFQHKMNSDDNEVAFMFFDAMEKLFEYTRKNVESEIDYCINAIRKQQRIKDNINAAQEELVQKISEMQLESNQIKME